MIDGPYGGSLCGCSVVLQTVTCEAVPIPLYGAFICILLCQILFRGYFVIRCYVLKQTICTQTRIKKFLIGHFGDSAHIVLK